MRFTGKVQRGLRRGRELGFPTVNITLDDASVSGIYAARVKVGDEEYEAAAYADPARGVLEAHLLDFDRDLYGWNVSIELFKKMREREHFSDAGRLQKTIAGDIAKIRKFFKN